MNFYPLDCDIWFQVPMKYNFLHFIFHLLLIPKKDQSIDTHKSVNIISNSYNYIIAIKKKAYNFAL